MKRLADHLSAMLVGILVTVGALIVLEPLIYTAAMSLDSRHFLGAFPPPSISMQWYVRFFESESYMRALTSSAIISLSAAVLATMLGVCAVIGLSQTRERVRRTISVSFSAPQLVPHVVLGFGLLLFFVWVGIENGYVRLICAHTIITLPYVIRLVGASLTGISVTVLEAGLSLGAKPWGVVRLIIVPLIKTGLVISFVFALAISLDDVSASIFLTNPDVVTLPIALVSNMKSSFDLTIAAASVMMMLFACAIVFVIARVVGLERLLGGGLYSSAGKIGN